MTTSIHSTRNSGRREGFTLVELLAVITIIGVMLVVAVPAFNQLGKGANMRTAINELRTTMSLARQWAITKRQTTYVVFADDNPDLYTGQYAPHANKAFRAYNVYSKEEGYIRDWTYLPEGIVLVPDKAIFGITAAGVSDFKNLFVVDLAHDWRIQIPFPDSSRSKPYPEIPVVAFSPKGSLYDKGSGVQSAGSRSLEIYISEGWVSVDGGTIGVMSKAKGNRMLFGLDYYNHFTGQMRLREYPNE